MANVMTSMSKFKLTRRGRKLQISDDPRTIIAMPKDVPERTWAEILQKEEVDLLVFDIREEIVENTLKLCYQQYMEKQNLSFTVHCAAQAWLKLINWEFYRHDPGEEPSSYPPCYIPKRRESWTPDKIPEPSPKDTWAMHELSAVETYSDEGLQRWPSSSSLEYPHVDEIPRECWFPGKVNLQDSRYRFDSDKAYDEDDVRKKPLVELTERSEVWAFVQAPSSTQRSRSEEIMATESEVLQKVTDYATEDVSKVSTSTSALKTTTPMEDHFTSASLQGAGDSSMVSHSKVASKSKTFSRIGSRSSKALPPIDGTTSSKSHMSIISDCRLRNLRLDTQYEISPEKIDTPPGEIVKRK